MTQARPLLSFILLVCMSLLLSFSYRFYIDIPVVNWVVQHLHLPFKWLETYFHEMSHGLAALLTGGSISHIELNLDGSGVCYTRGGIPSVISFAGYAGAVIWGCFLYILGISSSVKTTRYLSVIFAVAILLTLLLWMKGHSSNYIIMPFIISLFFLAFYSAENHAYIPQLFLKFSGVYVVISAIRSPLYLIDGKAIGDGAALQQSTGLPEAVWITIWLGFACAGLFFLLWLSWQYRNQNTVHSSVEKKRYI